MSFDVPSGATGLAICPDCMRLHGCELGFPSGEEVQLADYLEAASGCSDKKRAFERLCAHFASGNGSS